MSYYKSNPYGPFNPKPRKRKTKRISKSKPLKSFRKRTLKTKYSGPIGHRRAIIKIARNYNISENIVDKIIRQFFGINGIKYYIYQWMDIYIPYFGTFIMSEKRRKQINLRFWKEPPVIKDIEKKIKKIERNA